MKLYMIELYGTEDAIKAVRISYRKQESSTGNFPAVILTKELAEKFAEQAESFVQDFLQSELYQEPRK